MSETPQATPTPTPPAAPGLIEVGVRAADGEMDLWRAKEALRQAELRLTAQAQMRASLEARGTAMASWSTVSLLAVVAAGAAAPSWPLRAGAIVAGCMLFAAACAFLHGIRPQPDWGVPGYPPRLVTEVTLPSELEALQSLAWGHQPGILGNTSRLAETSAALRRGGTLLVTAPMAGAATVAAWAVVALALAR